MFNNLSESIRMWTSNDGIPENITSWTQYYNESLDTLWDSHEIFETFKRDLITLNQPNTIVLICLYVPVFLTAIIGNLTVLIVIIPNRRMWSVTNNFLLNLAIADLLVAFICVPMTVAEKIYKLWIYGDALCKLVPYLQGVSITASILTITMMSLDRCLAIRYPVRYRNKRTTKYVRLVVTIIWLISFLLAIPLLFVRSTSTMEIIEGEFLTYCLEDWQNNLQRQIYDIILLVLIFIIPGTTLVVAYVLMGKKLWVPDRKLSAERPITRRSGRTNSVRERSLRNITLNRRRLAKLCIAIAAVFIVCWTPYFIVNTYVDFQSDVADLHLLNYTLLIGHVHCVTNPILYCFLHKTFRHYVFPCLSGNVKKQMKPGVYAAPYMTLHRGPTYNSIRRESLKSLSLQRRTSSSTSSTHGRLEDRMASNNSSDVISDSLRDKLLSRNNFTTLDISKYTIRNLEIPSIIKEESRIYYSLSRSRSDCSLH